MYKIQHFDRKLCEGDSHCFDDCDVYSIWRFCPWHRWEALRQILFPINACACRPEWFPLIYWFALCISIMGFERKYRVVPLVFRRNVRLIGSAFMTRTWASLLIGIITVSPSAISSWLTIYFAIFCLELILWIGELVFGVIKLDMRSVWSHCASLGTYVLVRCVHGVFIRSIERHANMEELELMPKRS